MCPEPCSTDQQAPFLGSGCFSYPQQSRRHGNAHEDKHASPPDPHTVYVPVQYYKTDGRRSRRWSLGKKA